MGKFLAVFLAYVLICNDYLIFRSPPEEPPQDATYSSIIFLTAMFLLLYDLRLYPKELRVLDRFSQTIFEFFVAMFALEGLLLDFWYPLESGAKTMCIQGTQKLEELTDYNENVEVVTNFLKEPSTQTGISYFISVFFLLAVLHAIRAVDFRALQEGPGCFFGDIATRSKRFVLKKMRSLGFAKKRVKIKECKEMVTKRRKKEKESICKCKNKKGNGAIEELNEGNDINLDDDCDSFSFSDYDFTHDDEMLLCDE